jgi:hypothetical protein
LKPYSNSSFFSFQNAFIEYLILLGQCKPADCGLNANDDSLGNGRALNEDIAIQQLEVAIVSIIPHFECMDGVTDVFVSFD